MKTCPLCKKAWGGVTGVDACTCYGATINKEEWEECILDAPKTEMEKLASDMHQLATDSLRKAKVWERAALGLGEKVAALENENKELAERITTLEREADALAGRDRR